MPRIIVSLTSFPQRINTVWLTIETLLRQTVQPDYIILWLSKEQFDTKNNLPRNLLSLEKRGLSIRLVEDDLRSHKKYYYSFKEYPDDFIITVDDDTFYNTKVIEYLWRTHLQFPQCICCNHSRLLCYNEQELLPYSLWKHNYKYNFLPSKQLCAIGVGGILYPPHSLHSLVEEKGLFMKLCPNADDLWLKTMSLLEGNAVVQSEYHSYFMPIRIRGNTTLSSNNVKFGNDDQLKQIRQYFINKIHRDIFSYNSIMFDAPVEKGI